MIAGLLDHLAHLLPREPDYPGIRQLRLAELPHRDFGNQHNAMPIGIVQHEGILRIVHRARQRRMQRLHVIIVVSHGPRRFRQTFPRRVLVSGHPRQTDTRAIQQQMARPDLQCPHPESRIVVVQNDSTRSQHLDPHAIEIRMIEVPQLRLSQLERHFDFARTLIECDTSHLLRSHLVVRPERCDTQRHHRMAWQCAPEKYPIMNPRARSALLRTDTLAANPGRTAARQPHVANQTPVRPPIVRGCRTPARGDSGNGRHPGSIVEPDHQQVGRTQM